MNPTQICDALSQKKNPRTGPRAYPALTTPDHTSPARAQHAGSELLSLAELCIEARVSRRFLELEIARGRLVKLQLSNRIVRIRRSDWLDYLKRAAK